MPTTAENSVARTGLRPLNEVEEGTGFANLPAGVFGFTYAPLSESPLFSKDNYHSFEMQKLPDGSGRLVCWVTPEQAAAIKAGEFLDLYVYPDQWTDAAEQISIPVDRLKRRHRNPIREEGNRLEVTVSSTKS